MVKLLPGPSCRRRAIRAYRITHMANVLAAGGLRRLGIAGKHGRRYPAVILQPYLAQGRQPVLGMHDGHVYGGK